MAGGRSPEGRGPEGGWPLGGHLATSRGEEGLAGPVTQLVSQSQGVRPSQARKGASTRTWEGQSSRASRRVDVTGCWRKHGAPPAPPSPETPLPRANRVKCLPEGSERTVPSSPRRDPSHCTGPQGWALWARGGLVGSAARPSRVPHDPCRGPGPETLCREPCVLGVTCSVRTGSADRGMVHGPDCPPPPAVPAPAWLGEAVGAGGSPPTCQQRGGRGQNVGPSARGGDTVLPFSVHLSPRREKVPPPGSLLMDSPMSPSALGWHLAGCLSQWPVHTF